MYGLGQPGTFRTGKYGGTTHSARPPPALSGAPPYVLNGARVPVTSLSSNAAIIVSVKSPRVPTPSVANSHGVVPATVTRASSAVPLRQGTISTTGTRAPCAVPLGHGPNSAKGTRAPTRGINSPTGVRAPSADPLNHGRGACASRGAPPSHAPRSNEAAAPAHLLSERVHPLLSLTM